MEASCAINVGHVSDEKNAQWDFRSICGGLLKIASFKNLLKDHTENKFCDYFTMAYFIILLRYFAVSFAKFLAIF